jgi:hypothetical protein
VFVPIVILSWTHLVSCFVSHQPEQVHIAYGGKNYILSSVYKRLELTVDVLGHAPYFLNGEL